MINREAIYTPDKGQVLFLRGDLSGKTTQWALRLSGAGLWLPHQGQWAIQLTGNIEGSSFASAIDDRIEQQRKSIDTMLDHLKEHCPKLLGTGECPHIGQATTKAGVPS